MNTNVADIYRRSVKDLIIAQNSESPCPFDGFSCCSICKDCGRRFCECASYNCERELGLGCSGTRDEGCPKEWCVKRA